jgi:membrane protease YdiL (CAAX protease family)
MTAKKQVHIPRVVENNARSRAVRNLILYLVGVMTLSVLGGLLSAGGQGVGDLVFITSPLLMAVLLRTVGGDGWSDAGLRLGPARWYVFAFLVFPVTIGLIVFAGATTGTIEFDGSASVIVGAMAAQFVPSLLFAMFEEWGWRGFLEPRLATLGVFGLRRHLLVGLVWASWHIPYIIGTPGYSELSPYLFAPLFLAGLLLMAVVYGRIREASGSVWPAGLAHGTGNALAFPLILGGHATFDMPALFSPRPENIAFVILWTVIAMWVLRRTRP